MSDATRFVGRDIARPDAPAKLAGRAIYVDDLVVPGSWYGGAVRSDVARGVLQGFDFAPGFDARSVVVAGPRDVPGENVVALLADDQPLLAACEIEHWGEPLLLVAAPTRPALERALASIRPRIEPREPCFDAERSTRTLAELEIAKGDVDAAFARAAGLGAVVVEGEYSTGSQEQLYVEPQGAIAWPPDEAGVVEVRGSLQCPHYVQKALCRAFALPPEKARVVQTETGGGFGGKEDYPSVVACHAALLARAAGRPVRVVYERHEDLATTPKRHPSRVRHRTLVARDGTLLALDVDLLFDGGAYTTLSPVVLSRGSIHAAGAYRCDNVRIRGRAVATNHVPYGAFRGFGAPQTCFAIERQLDRIARALSIHPAELREKNRLRPGDSTATGQVLVESVGSREVLEDVLARSGFARRAWCGIAPRAPAVSLDPGSGPRPGERRGAERSSGVRGPRRLRRGLGLSFFFHGAGFTGSGEARLAGRVRVALAGDGRAEVQAGSTEIGQGTGGLFLALAAESLGTEPDDVRLATPDTARVPDSGPTVASRTCMVVGSCLERACRELAARVGGDRSLPFRERARAFLARGGDGVATATYGPPPGLAWDEENHRGDAYPVYGWAADVAEVEVDLDTFEVDVVRFWTTVDVGRAIQPLSVEGQVEGGSLQAIGFAHREVVTMSEGRCEQDRLATCVVPTSLDAPRFETRLVEVPYLHGPFGAKGVGELPMDGGAPAVVSAIEDAIGVHAAELPATPERLCAAWLAAHPEERA